jgi:hypothetical protein
MSEGKFRNYLTDDFTDDAVEEERPGVWYIKMGFAGFNSPMNNLWGYATKAQAERAILRYQNR